MSEEFEEGLEYGAIQAHAQVHLGCVAVQINDRLDPKLVATILLSPENSRALAWRLTTESFKVEDGAE